MENIYMNRELSWLKFNERVLEEAENNEVPLCERMNFVSIYQSNLAFDERNFSFCRDQDCFTRETFCIQLLPGQKNALQSWGVIQYFKK